MEQEAGLQHTTVETETVNMADIVVEDVESFVNVELEIHSESTHHSASVITNALFQDEENDGDSSDEDDDDDDDDSGTDHFNCLRGGTQLQRCARPSGLNSGVPDTFQTSHLLFYERFKAYQDYMLGDCKPSEVKAFTADYLKKVLEPCDWLALWCTDMFDVLVEVQDLDLKDLKACVQLVLPMQCDTRGCDLTEEAMVALLEATQHQVPLQELYAIYDPSGEFDQIALALEHLRFFYKHIWRQWDEEDEDDDFDYFVRCVEPRLRLYYDILEGRVPAGLVSEYQSLLELCSQCFNQFSSLRSELGSDSDSELDNVSMVEGLKLYEQLETLRRRLHIIENPLLRYVLGNLGNSSQHSVQSRGPRCSGLKVVHVVTSSCSSLQLQSLLNNRLLPPSTPEDTQIQFHSDPVSAVNSCYQGDVVLVLPGVYSVSSSLFIPDSVSVEGFGPPDEVVIEKTNKGDSFVESTGAEVTLSNIKFIQHDAIEGILCVRQGTVNMENCVLQCETTGVIVRTSACLNMNRCDLYGSKGAGVEIYPGSVCNLIGNGIHHCKDGILIKDLENEPVVMPSITMENNVIHNNEGYGVILVKPQDTKTQTDGGDSAGRPADTPLIVQLPSAENSTEGGASVESGASTLGRKWSFSRQLSRNKETSCVSRAIEDLTELQVFASIKGNQFKRNGMGDYGTFYY